MKKYISPEMEMQKAEIADVITVSFATEGTSDSAFSALDHAFEIVEASVMSLFD